jgi:hypothetical protein
MIAAMMTRNRKPFLITVSFRCDAVSPAPLFLLFCACGAEDVPQAVVPLVARRTAGPSARELIEIASI